MYQLMCCYLVIVLYLMTQTVKYSFQCRNSSKTQNDSNYILNTVFIPFSWNLPRLLISFILCLFGKHRTCNMSLLSTLCAISVEKKNLIIDLTTNNSKSLQYNYLVSSIMRFLHRHNYVTYKLQICLGC